MLNQTAINIMNIVIKILPKIIALKHRDFYFCVFVSVVSTGIQQCYIQEIF